MRVLYASHFDPAGVMAGHRAALRAAGVEAYLALNADYRAEGADGACPAPDVLVVCPGIGSGAPKCWATTSAFPAPEVDLPPEVRQIVEAFPRAKRVAYFHGSTSLAANASAYAARYRGAGYVLAASTLDYAWALGAAYLPPAITIPSGVPSATHRGDDEPLVVAHTPTNWAVCSTEALLSHAKSLGIDVRLATCTHPRTALVVKGLSHATFDHLRGSFSVNSLEAAALGSIPLFGTSLPVRARMVGECIDPAPVHLTTCPAGLHEVLLRLRNDPALTRHLQGEARRWSQQFTPAATAKRLVALYESL